MSDESELHLQPKIRIYAVDYYPLAALGVRSTAKDPYFPGIYKNCTFLKSGRLNR